MKNAFGILLVFAALFCMVSCGKQTTAEEINSIASQSDKENSVSESKQEAAISDSEEKVADELGKTKKNKQLVAKLTYGDHIEYQKIVFDSNGLADYKLTYKYFDNDSYYETVLGYGDASEGKLVDQDKDVRCLTYKGDCLDIDYDTYYNLYERKDPDVCTIIK